MVAPDVTSAQWDAWLWPTELLPPCCPWYGPFLRRGGPESVLRYPTPMDGMDIVVGLVERLWDVKDPKVQSALVWAEQSMEKCLVNSGEKRRGKMRKVVDADADKTKTDAEKIRDFADNIAAQTERTKPKTRLPPSRTGARSRGSATIATPTQIPNATSSSSSPGIQAAILRVAIAAEGRVGAQVVYTALREAEEAYGFSRGLVKLRQGEGD